MDRQPARQGPANLIEQLLAQPLEPAYEAEHARRSRPGAPRPTPRARLASRLAMLLTTVLIGVVVVVGYQTLRAPDAVSSPRAELAQRLSERQQLQREQSDALAREQRAVEEEQRRALTSGGRDDLAETYQAHASAAAATEVSGDGLRIRLDDPAVEDPAQRVIAADLQRLVNLLWTAGAEDVAINGHRLSATAGIRFAGKALVVDFRALDRPYTIEAIGPEDLPARFDELGGDTQLSVLRDDFGIQARLDRASGIVLAPDPTLTLHHARPITVEAP
ncbi:DUF881 domain-containing protein [Kytococcus sedentarius]|uniref:DUF881 domain-containing protein n=1 Tax=Kytococcus sedentarius TaxID=1276 RepID=UPI0035BBA3D7